MFQKNKLNDIIRLGELRIWSSYKGLIRKKPKLEHLLWESTLRCNFFCQHCGSNAGNSAHPSELTAEEIKKFFSQLAIDFTPNKITISITGGEPLLQKDFLKEMLSYLAQVPR